MTNEQANVRDWMKAFGQETPEKPEIPSLEVRKLRAKLILEEALETLEGLGFKLNDPCTGLQFNIMAALNHCSIVKPNLTEILDGCEDLKVVTEGTLIACGLVTPNEDPEVYEDPYFNEVMRSN